MINIETVIVYPLTVDWDHLHQRPQQLLKALSRNGYISIFCNTNIEQKHPNGIEFLTDHLILANGMNVNDAISFARSWYPYSKVGIYYSYPPQSPHIRSGNQDFVIFDSLDEPVHEFAHWLPDYESAVRNADIVMTSSVSLYNRASQYRNDVVLVPNGCDYDHFAQIQNTTFKTKNKKVVGFVGAVATWLDWELIRMISYLPLVELVFVGPLYGLNSPLQRPNIKYLGHVPYDQIPKKITEFDVCLIPFLLNDMTKGVNPIKFWEYLATGKPVISTALPEVLNTGLATIIDHKNYATAQICDSYSDRINRMEYAKKNSWNERAKRMIEVIQCILK